MLANNNVSTVGRCIPHQRLELLLVRWPLLVRGALGSSEAKQLVSHIENNVVMLHKRGTQSGSSGTPIVFKTEAVGVHMTILVKVRTCSFVKVRLRLPREDLCAKDPKDVRKVLKRLGSKNPTGTNLVSPALVVLITIVLKGSLQLLEVARTHVGVGCSTVNDGLAKTCGQKFAVEPEILRFHYKPAPRRQRNPRNPCRMVRRVPTPDGHPPAKLRQAKCEDLTVHTYAIFKQSCHKRT
mmetsp:Transcript_48943/g.129681  ORF Transcript_48943/g.129681 Transcript_48943/m.129681 type:complete len:239 (+) Transcript_48943:247-963(+)